MSAFGRALRGAISSRLRKGLKTGEITPNMINPPRQKETPKTSDVRHGSGRGLGRGATRRRNGGN